MAKFSTISGDGESYPKVSYDGQEDQSYGFNPAFKLQTGNTRGTQTVGYGNVKIDGANNQITVGGITLDGNTNTITSKQSDGSINGFGVIPGSITGETGFFAVDKTGTLVWKNVIGTQSYYNPVDNYNNSIIIGGSPDDGRTGIWVSKPGLNTRTLLGGS